MGADLCLQKAHFILDSTIYQVLQGYQRENPGSKLNTSHRLDDVIIGAGPESRNNF